MFFLASKILHFLISPTTWIAGLLALCLFSRDLNRKRRFFRAAIVVFLFFSNSFILDEFNRLWEVPAQKPGALIGSYDGIIVLGGVSGFDPRLEKIQINRGFDRVMQGINLLREGKAPRLFFTGGSGSISYPEIKEGLYLESYLKKVFNLSDSSLIFESESKNTYENSLFMASLLEKMGLHKGRYILVTSSWHMRRALACFKERNINCIPYSADRWAGPRKFAFDHLLLPNSQALTGWDQLIHEWVGTVTYRLAGYI